MFTVISLLWSELLRMNFVQYMLIGMFRPIFCKYWHVQIPVLSPFSIHNWEIRPHSILDGSFSFLSTKLPKPTISLKCSHCSSSSSLKHFQNIPITSVDVPACGSWASMPPSLHLWRLLLKYGRFCFVLSIINIYLILSVFEKSIRSFKLLMMCLISVTFFTYLCIVLKINLQKSHLLHNCVLMRWRDQWSLYNKSIHQRKINF